MSVMFTGTPPVAELLFRLQLRPSTAFNRKSLSSLSRPRPSVSPATSLSRSPGTLTWLPSNPEATETSKKSAWKASCHGGGPPTKMLTVE